MVLIDQNEQINLAITLAAGLAGGVVGVSLRKGRDRRKWSESIALCGNGAIIGSVFAAGAEWKYPESNVAHIFVAAVVSLIVSRWGERSLLWLLDLFLARSRRLLELWLASGGRASHPPADERESGRDDANFPPADT
jgi:hypothetical protein